MIFEGARSNLDSVQSDFGGEIKDTDRLEFLKFYSSLSGNIRTSYIEHMF